MKKLFKVQLGDVYIAAENETEAYNIDNLLIY